LNFLSVAADCPFPTYAIGSNQQGCLGALVSLEIEGANRDLERVAFDQEGAFDCFPGSFAQKSVANLVFNKCLCSILTGRPESFLGINPNQRSTVAEFPT
jgi:hypothetical protein